MSDKHEGRVLSEDALEGIVRRLNYVSANMTEDQVPAYASQLEELLVSLIATVRHLQSRLDAVTAKLPGGYYTHLEAPERVGMLAEHWQRAIEVNKQLEEQIDEAQARLDGAEPLMRAAEKYRVHCTYEDNQLGQQSAMLDLLAIARQSQPTTEGAGGAGKQGGQK